MEICQGVVRRLLTLDTIINSFLRSPVDTLPPLVRDGLRAGAYQILYLDRVPDHAAVNEAVNMARKAGGVSFARLTNGVLRNLIRRRDGGESLLPSVAHDADRMALEHSFPLWMVRRWWERFGGEETVDMLAACNAPPCLTLRAFGEAGREDVALRLREEASIEAEPCRWASRGLRLPPATAVSRIPETLWTAVQVQDEASQLVGELLGVEKGDRVLDACAAPGGKTALFAEAAGNDGEIVALERDPERRALLDDNLARLGPGNVRTMTGDIMAGGFDPGGVFDRVLVDAPCSGLGVLRRHPEIKWRRQPVDVQRNGRQALEMLSGAARFVKTGGVLEYAVCSTEQEEGEDVAERFSEREEFVLVPVEGAFASGPGYFRSWPHRHGIDGFFAARWRRMG